MSASLLLSRNTLFVLLTTGVGVAVSTTTAADDPPAAAPAVSPAEESRLSTAVFRAGLKKRGLTELLELHLTDFPPRNPTEASLMMRDVRLAEFADPTLALAQRRAAVDEANRILEAVVEAYPDDPRRFEWRFALAHSLLYDQAEPFFTHLLYRGGGAADRRQLLHFTTRAVKAIRALLRELLEEYDRIDAMSIQDFEQLERRGYVENLDRLGPRAEYLLLWVLFYDSLPRTGDDPTRVSRLNEIVEWIKANPRLVKTPHETSRVQVQALLLAGMSHRLLYNHQAAREHLERALAVAQDIGDAAERQRIEWAVTLAWLERIRNDRDDGLLDSALNRLAQFRRIIATGSGDDFGLTTVAALLERSVHRARAAGAARDGRTQEAEQYREAAWKPLAQLARQEPQRRDELYAMLYEMIDSATPLEQLDPFEQCALMASLLFDADQSPEAADSLWDRVIEVGERFLADTRPGAEALVPEVRYNTAVAQYRRGRLAAAAQGFLHVAKEHPTFGNAERAATFAVQLGSEIYRDPSFHPHPETQQLYRESLNALTTRYRHTEAARYWRFFHAQLLEELGDYDGAAAEYAWVDQAHEHYVESVFFRARCLALAVQLLAAEASTDGLDLQRRTHDFFTAQRDFVTLATSELGRERDMARRRILRSLVARVRLIAAEVQVLPHCNQPAQALAALDGFEVEYPSEKASAGRVWRVRLLAYEQLGRLDETVHAIQAYIAADRAEAGPTLQSLYLALAAEAEKLRAVGDMEAAQRKADVALLLAEQVDTWAAGSDNASGLLDPDALTLQLAEANLRAGHFQHARELFESLAEAQETSTEGRALSDSRVVLGHAEALFQLGAFGAALPQFNRLATGLPPSDPIRWKALLRDLQCRTALKEPAQGIIKVIHQQRHLYPDLGGPELAPLFEKLLRENERRAN